MPRTVAKGSTTASLRERAVSRSGVDNRLTWVDRAKGLTIILVVMSHVIEKHHFQLEWDLTVPSRGGWREINELFRPMRMPLFLMLSGLLASSALQRSWRQVFARRVANPYALYLMWFAINVCAVVVFDFADAEGLELSATGLLRNLVIPQTTLWYMFALVAYFVAAMMLRPLGRSIPVVLAALLSTATYAYLIPLPDSAGMLESILRYFLPFLIGAMLPAVPMGVAASKGPALVILAVTAYVIVWMGFRQGATRVLGFGTVGIVIGALAGVLLTTRLTRPRKLSSLLERIGRNTLSIFVLHIPLLAALHWAMTTGPVGHSPFGSNDVIAAAYPLVATAALVACALAIQTACTRCGLGWLFVLPIGRAAAETPTDLARPTRAPTEPETVRPPSEY